MESKVRFLNSILNWLETGRTELKLASIALLLGLPALGGGWMMDDYAHLAAFADVPRLNEIFRSPWHMFSFVSGEAGQTRAAMEHGLYPWWSSENVVLNFWRPVTVLTHGIDHLLWPNSALLAHLQSLLWYAALVILTTRLYRKVGGPAWPVALAALLFTVDDAHAIAMGWVASRNATLAAFWGVACLLLHIRWRERASLPALMGAILALAASVQSNEGGIATTGYLFAYAMFLERGPLTRRLLTLIPYALLVLAWRGAYSWYGFGALLSPLYIDPVRDPLRFLTAVVERYPALMNGQWTNFPSEAFFILKGTPVLLLWAASLIMLLVVAAGVAVPALRTRTAGFWATGMALAALPVCATFPSNRLLMFTGLGAMGLMAEFIHAVRNNRNAYGRGRRWLCGLLVLLHLVLAPLALVASITGFGVIARAVRHSVDEVQFPADIENRTLVLVSAPNYFMTAYMVMSRLLDGRPAPARLYMLSPNNPTVVPMTVARTDARTLRVSPKGGYPWMLFRSKSEPFSPDDEINLKAMRVRILEVNGDGVPQAVDYIFDAPLEDDRYLWMELKGFRYQSFDLPQVGETLRLNDSDP